MTARSKSLKTINTGFYAKLSVMKSGKLIVIEGCDGTGKETQANWKTKKHFAKSVFLFCTRFKSLNL